MGPRAARALGWVAVVVVTWLVVSGLLLNGLAALADRGFSVRNSTTAESDQASAYFGYSVGTAGDVKGDGYDDVVVGAFGYDNGQINEGRAFL